MRITRRDFLKYCTASAAALGLTPAGLKQLQAALASGGAPTLIWLHGSGCQGDSISFLNLFANVEPVGDVTAGSVLIEHVNLAYHTVVMASAGQTAVDMARDAQQAGGYVLVLEGGVPTAFGGKACMIMTDGDKRITYHEAVLDLAADAAVVLCVGTCASFGGIPMSGKVAGETNPTDVKSCPDVVKGAYPEKLVINIAGCPAHPDWIAWAVVQLILGNDIQLDEYLRPVALYGNQTVDRTTLNVHENCPRKEGKDSHVGFATTFGQDHYCLENLGCRGPVTFSDCPSRRWNKGENGPVNWCVDANAVCIGCVQPNFPVAVSIVSSQEIFDENHSGI